MSREKFALKGRGQEIGIFSMGFRPEIGGFLEIADPVL